MARARVSPTPVDVVEVVDGGPHDLLQRAEPADDAVDDRLGQAGDAGQQPVAAGLDVGVEVDGVAGQLQRRAHRREVEQLFGAHGRQRVHRLVELPVAVVA